MNLERQMSDTVFSRFRLSLLYLLRELHLWLNTFTFPRKLSFSLRPPWPIRSLATAVCPMVSLKLSPSLRPPSPILLLAFAIFSLACGGSATQANRLGLEPMVSMFSHLLGVDFSSCFVGFLNSVLSQFNSLIVWYRGSAQLFLVQQSHK